ncbi:antibiotic biosynthesis monooxygenase family protein [Amycolatopsis sp. NPDC003676]
MFVFINRYSVTGDRAAFERVLGRIKEHMRQQEGWHSHRLYQSVRDPDVYIETAEWVDAAAHRRATSSDGFRIPVREIGALATVNPGPFVEVTQQLAEPEPGPRP